VNELAKQQGMAQLPKLSSSELAAMGFNKDAFAQMDVKHLSNDDLKQVVMLGLAADDMF